MRLTTHSKSTTLHATSRGLLFLVTRWGGSINAAAAVHDLEEEVGGMGDPDDADTVPVLEKASRLTANGSAESAEVSAAMDRLDVDDGLLERV